MYTPLFQTTSRGSILLAFLAFAFGLSGFILGLLAFLSKPSDSSPNESTRIPSGLITSQRDREVLLTRYPFAVRGPNSTMITLQLPTLPLPTYVFVVLLRLRFSEYTLGQGAIINDIDGHESHEISWTYTLDTTWSPLQLVPGNTTSSVPNRYTITTVFNATHHQLVAHLQPSDSRYLTGLLDIEVGDIYPASQTVFSSEDLSVFSVKKEST